MGLFTILLFIYIKYDHCELSFFLHCASFPTLMAFSSPRRTKVGGILNIASNSYLISLVVTARILS
jgi:hypothetical protein